MWSTLNKCEYDEHDAVRIINPKQAAFYWIKGVQPISIYPSRDYESNDILLVFIFKKSETRALYEEWCTRKKE